MSEDPHNRPAPPPGSPAAEPSGAPRLREDSAANRRPVDEGEAGGKLDAAIDELEQMLEAHGLDAGEGGQPLDGEQYTIPLLDDVVLPGTVSEATEESRSAAPVTPAALRLARIAERYRPIFERLASEIEVIVESGVDEALELASKEIVRRVNEHLEIVLPEILDDLSHADDKTPS